MSDHDEVERIAAVWQVLTDWLATHAPLSFASLLPPAPEEDIRIADTALRQHLGFGLPSGLAALWGLCGGVTHQIIEADEEGEVASGAFLPGGVVLPPAQALGLRLPVGGGRDGWGGAPVVPWLTRDEAGPEHGLYAGPQGVGDWSIVDEPAGEAVFSSIAVYLETVHRTLTVGPADLMGSDVPGLVWGCLVWDDPENPGLDEAGAFWRQVH
ncbi:hypothetical protein AB0G74_16850 [Streptomyces sp. NPDC020875]|uniref:hypothetical protein n=1 Tax=Streptomyces sp. NPDC020875 TaxID=3154898 RepID=UPI0033D06906